MRRFLAILFLFAFLNANTAFGEMLKLPVLMEHYLEHTQEDNTNSFFNFYIEHYRENIIHHHQSDCNHHDNLPFKTIDGHFSSIVSIVSPNDFVITHKTVITTDLQLPIYNQQNYSNTYLNSIWQPPRFS